MSSENVNRQGGVANPSDSAQPSGFDTSGRVSLEGSRTSSAGKSESTEPNKATAGSAPTVTVESRSGVKVEISEDEDFFRHLMETNEPVPGLSAVNADWHTEYPSQ